VCVTYDRLWPQCKDNLVLPSTAQTCQHIRVGDIFDARFVVLVWIITENHTLDPVLGAS
jgi:hypothetical protein